jgi:hypothetical protein
LIHLNFTLDAHLPFFGFSHTLFSDTQTPVLSVEGLSQMRKKKMGEIENEDEGKPEEKHGGEELGDKPKLGYR